MEDTLEIRDDEGLREILPLEKFPSSDATGDWLRRMGSSSGLEGLEKVNKRSLKRGMKYDGIKGYTLDIDAIGILAKKELAKLVGKKNKSSQKDFFLNPAKRS